MKEFFCNPATWLTLTSIFIACVALFQTHKQIELSNKQHLFDRRLFIYGLLNDLMNNCKNNLNFLSDKEIFACPEFLFTLICSSLDLEDVETVIDEDLTLEKKMAFLDKCLRLERWADEITFLWKLKNIDIPQNFILNFVDFLRELFRQYLFIKFSLPKDTDRISFIEDKISSEILEQDTNFITLKLSLDKLKDSYNEMLENNILENMRKNITL